MSHETIDPWLRRIVLHLEGSLPPDEVEELDRWRSSSAENDRLYREYEAIWREATGADGLGYVNWDAVASARPTAADLVMGRSRQTAKAGAVGRRPGARRRRFAVAAAIAAAVLLGFMGARVLLDDTPVYAQELITGPQEMVTGSLGDGTVMRLAPESRVRFKDQGGGRDVWLYGRAFFAVAHREGKRFVVNTDLGRIVVLGTRFEVESRGENLRLTVLEGTVELVYDGGRIKVTAGRVAFLSRGAAPTVVEVADVPSLFQWMGSFLAFQNTPFRQVVAEIEAMYGITIEVHDSVLLDRVVTGWFSEQEAMEVLGVVCRVISAQCTFDGTTATVRAVVP